MGLVKRTNGYWYVRVKRDGRAHWKSLRTRKRPTAGEAAVAQVALWEELSRRGHAGFPHGLPSATELAHDFIQGMRARVSDAHATRTEYCLALAVHHLGPDVRSWEAQRIQRYLDSGIAGSGWAAGRKTWKPRTAVLHRQALSRFLAWIVSRGVIEVNPMLRVEKPRVDLVPPQPPTTADVKRVLHAARDYDRRLEARGERAWLERAVRFAYSTGLRRGELTALDWRDVNLRAGRIRVRAATSKSKRDRIVPFTRRARRALSGVPPPERKGLVFGELADRHESDNLLNDLTRRRGGAIGFQSLRQWFCSLLAMRRVQPSVVQAIAGHADVTTTLRHYVGIPSEHLVSELARSRM